MIKLIKKFLRGSNHYKIQSFTFFIPSPPPRSTGYREKQFDKLFYEFMGRGYQLISINTEQSTGINQSGMWVICIVQAMNDQANKLNLDDFSLNNSDAVEGLYYIDEKNEKN